VVVKEEELLGRTRGVRSLSLLSSHRCMDIPHLLIQVCMRTGVPVMQELRDVVGKRQMRPGVPLDFNDWGRPHGRTEMCDGF
jgi:hypothetical protein